VGRLDTVAAAQVKPRRGVTFIEVMASMGVMAMGIAAISSLVLASTSQNRRTLAQAQAEAVAQRELERIVALGCSNGTSDTAFCDNIRALDRTGYQVAWGAASQIGSSPSNSTRQYRVDIDVDGPGLCNGAPCFEGSETGAPLLSRQLVPGQPAPRVLNVRVIVSWVERERPRQAVVLQTRVAP
jgi:type II secretory pathway pseudopilin PulG